HLTRDGPEAGQVVGAGGVEQQGEAAGAGGGEQRGAGDERRRRRVYGKAAAGGRLDLGRPGAGVNVGDRCAGDGRLPRGQAQRVLEAQVDDVRHREGARNPEVVALAQARRGDVERRAGRAGDDVARVELVGVGQDDGVAAAAVDRVVAGRQLIEA